jgi:dethiobiotin synthetase/malonyl-CoA O-methyltransferase
MTTKGFFISGTDTNVGKTVVSSWLVHHLNADYWKPVQSGIEGGTDTERVCQLANLSSHRIHPEAYLFHTPLSPHLAAALEQVEIDLDQINLPKVDAPIIVEGSGGVMVPLNKNALNLDLIEKMGLPTIIVARNRTGTINHTCLTIAALRQRNLPIAGVILVPPFGYVDDNSGFANKQAIEYYGKVKVLHVLEAFDPLAYASIASCYLPQVIYDLLEQQNTPKEKSTVANQD